MNTWIDDQLYFAWFDFGEVCLRHYCLRAATKRESLLKCFWEGRSVREDVLLRRKATWSFLLLWKSLLSSAVCVYL